MTTSSPPFTRRLINTPMRDLLRGRITGRLDLDAQLAALSLPPEAVHCIRTTIKRTRLWRLEKSDVAAELIAHFADGLAAGVAVDQLITDFGDPRKAAKLIRRAKHRQRPLIWHVQHRCRQALLVLLGIYLAMWGWLIAGEPNPKVDYFAIVNKTTNLSSQEDMAWPIYRAALIRHHAESLDHGVFYDTRKQRLVMPGDPAWSLVEALLDQNAELLEAIREGAQKPRMGLQYSARQDVPDEDMLAATGRVSDQQRPSANHAETLARQALIQSELPQLHPIGRMVNLLNADLLRAADARDSDRVLLDVRCMLSLASQCGEAAALSPAMIANNVVQRALRSLVFVLTKYPDLLEDAQLVTLIHQLTALEEIAAIHLDVQLAALLDLMQRIYDEEGRITQKGLRVMTYLPWSPMSEGIREANDQYHGALTSMGLPATYGLIASRDEVEAQCHRLMGMMEEYVNSSMWELFRSPDLVEEQLQQWRSSPLDRIRYWPLIDHVPAWGGYSKQLTLATRDLVQVAIALELYRRRHGEYPQSLTMLAPRYLPQAPVDHSTGKPLLYKIVDGKPLLHGRGLDGDDDGGVMTEEGRRRWPQVPAEGDWVLYPYPHE